MAKFFVFVPSSESTQGLSTDAILASVGLDFLTGLSKPLTGRPLTGPDEKQGMLFGWVTPQDNRLQYEPSKQTWIPSAAIGTQQTGAYYVGFWTEEKPGEQDLRRPDYRRGVFQVLGNKESWAFPSLENLERYPQLNPDGSIKWCVDDQHNWLVSEIDKRKSTMFASSDGESLTVLYDFDTDWRFLIRVLNLNYFLPVELAAHLKLISLAKLKELIAAYLGVVLRGDDE